MPLYHSNDREFRCLVALEGAQSWLPPGWDCKIDTRSKSCRIQASVGLFWQWLDLKSCLRNHAGWWAQACRNSPGWHPCHPQRTPTRQTNGGNRMDRYSICCTENQCNDGDTKNQGPTSFGQHLARRANDVPQSLVSSLPCHSSAKKLMPTWQVPTTTSYYQQHQQFMVSYFVLYCTARATFATLMSQLEDTMVYEATFCEQKPRTFNIQPHLKYSR